MTAVAVPELWVTSIPANCKSKLMFVGSRIQLFISESQKYIAKVSVSIPATSVSSKRISNVKLLSHSLIGSPLTLWAENNAACLALVK